MATAENPLEGIKQDKDGNFVDVVDLGDGSGLQVFKGKTVAELLGKYRKAQEHATRKIREQALALKLRDTPDPAKPLRKYEPHTPTADELFQLSEDLKDPTRVAAALNRAVSWELGADLEEVRATLRAIQIEQARREIFRAGDEFTSAHPEFKRCPENEQAIYAYLDKNNLAYTRKNFEIAFGELKSGLILVSPGAAPPTGEERETPIAPVVTRPRIAATGLSPRSSTAVPPAENPSARQGRLTAEAINAMPTAEYERKLRDPIFAAEAEKVLQEAAKRQR